VRGSSGSRNFSRCCADELPPDLVKSQQAALLDQFVQESLLKQRASRYGYHVSDQDLAARVMEYPQFQVDGKFSKDRYNAWCARAV
jgi:peptidyl-prolyl cis-trans isomerase D